MNNTYNFYPEHLTNEQLAELKKIILAEEEKRTKEKEYQVLLNLRNSLREFMESGIWLESCSIREECEIVDGTECNTADGDEWAEVHIEVFSDAILRAILNELTRNLGDY
jgi:hypothetical protein